MQTKPTAAQYAGMIGSALLLLAGACRAVIEEPPTVQKAFADINAKLATVKNFEASFVARSVDTIDGALTTTGMIAQQPPFAFRRATYVEEKNGSVRRQELTVCDGKIGWHVVSAPNGMVVNASRWGETSVEETFYVMMPKSRVFMLSHDLTNTYTALRRVVLFDRCERRADTTVFTGHYLPQTPQYAEMSRVACGFGPEGMSNVLLCNVSLTINDMGIPIEFTRCNLLGQPMQHAVLSNVRVNSKLPVGTFAFTPAPGTPVFDTDRARSFEPIHVTHELLGVKAPVIATKYLAGNEATITPGSAPIVLTFFASWSGNCRKYMPALERLYQTYAGKGVTFVCITDEVEAKTVRKFCKSERLTLPIYIDDTHRVTKSYSIQVVPKTMVINREGIVVDVLEGNAPGIEGVLEDSIKQCLQTPSLLRSK